MSRARLAAPALLAFALAGCANRLVFEPAAAPPSPPAQRIRAPLVVEEVALFDGTRPVGIDDGFVNRIVMELRRVRAFRAVLPPESAAQAPHDAVWVWLAVSERFDEHWGANAARAVATGLSLLTLSPFVRFDAGYRVSVRGEARTCDGWTRRYGSDVAGTLSYGFFTDEREGRSELGGVVMERALRETFDQLAGDAALAVRVEDLERNQDCPQREQIR